jgi:hypothetical protein
VFHELTGEMWIDPARRRLVRMRGQLRANVKFAGGLLGYLQKVVTSMWSSRSCHLAGGNSHPSTSRYKMCRNVRQRQ